MHHDAQQSNGIALLPIDGKAKDKQGADSLSVPRDAKKRHSTVGKEWRSKGTE